MPQLRFSNGGGSVALAGIEFERRGIHIRSPCRYFIRSENTTDRVIWNRRHINHRCHLRRPVLPGWFF